MTTEIHGDCDERFAPVRDAFANNFLEHDELGAAVALSVDGQPVVDIWGGWADEAQTRRWERDTLVDVFSVGKAMAALCLLILAERGKVELDAPVADLWPEFAAHGKEGITARMLLSHRAGLPGVRRRELPETAMYDWGLMAEALADEEPVWPPGTKHGYHVNSFGFLVGEVVRRASGREFGGFFAAEVAGPLDADFQFGTTPEDDARTADFFWGPDQLERGAREALRLVDVDPELDEDEERKELLRCVYFNPPGISGVGPVNTREWRAAVMPSTNGHASARAVARIFSALACGGAVDGVRLLDPATIEEATREASSGPDVILGRPSRFGLGFQLTQPERPLGTSPPAFGHFGAGGALGFADPDARLAFGYVANRAGARWQNPRNKALLDAVYGCL